MKTLPPATPVIVGIGVNNQKFADPKSAQTAIQLMIGAVKKAAEDAGASQLLEDCGKVMVPQGLWSYSDPGRLIADEIGAQHAKTLLAKFGILQTTLLGEAAQRIANKQEEVVIVTGGEARYRGLMGEIKGIALDDTQQDDAAPDEFLEPQSEMWLEAESNAGLGMPVGYYAIMEIARRHASNMGVDEHRDFLGNLYSHFADIAVDNPYAWTQQAITASEVSQASDKNAMLAFPYTKKLNTSWNVDQSSALILCSVEKAQALNIPRSKWIFPSAIVDSNHMLCVSQNRDLARSVGAEIAAQRALALSGLSADQLDYIDLYSCFPIAVQLYADALNLGADQEYTFTGGMPYAGGPLNNYVLQSACRLVELLRAKPDSHGLISAVSGMLTKQGFGIFSALPPEKGFVFDDVTQQVAGKNVPVEVVEDFSGEANVASYTVLHEKGLPWRLVAVCDTPDGQRAIALSEDKQAMERAMTDDLCEQPVSIDDGQLTLH